MSEEEKKAIENLKFCLTTNNEISIYDGTTILVKITDIQILLNLLSKKDKVMDDIETYCRNQIAFKNMLVRSKEEITEFNKGRFDICEEILYLIDTMEEENDNNKN